eukprot:CAMPEP_0201902528 /NCGR_PEP_ID=MMETSP0902-20130614/55000_1 /ASSEMBLY_ACC=CAM_ASM_000551 /TAXON_ID=420261 /ORGANISM="Thalassiosira antarctica, Strain CCMP982" /LENGTH=497 /DNA_ID=CAMNT_0048436531 /DNA_START=126 /DNA_END=1616 /DNA_ORIENTATION=+
MVTAQQKKIWNEKYDLLVEYKQEHGHCNVPQSGIFNSQNLGSWVDTQRRSYRKGTLLHDRLVRLNEIGFNWSVYDVMGRTMCVRVSWEEQFKQLVKFKGKHGHCNVTQRYLDNPSLGKWVNEQRRGYKGKKLEKDRIDRLNGIGFTWDRRPNWEERFKQLEEFKEEHGHCIVPRKYLNNPSLGTWVNEQRQCYRGKGGKKLEKDRIDRLNGMGFTWEPVRGGPRGRRPASVVSEDVEQSDADEIGFIGFTWEVRRDRRPASVVSEDVEQSDADASNDVPIDGEGRFIEETEAPTAKSTTRRTNETNDEREPPEISDSRAVREKRATKRNASSCNTKEDLQAHWRGKKAKRSAIPESGTNATRSEGALKSSVSTTTAAATTAQAAQGQRKKAKRSAIHELGAIATRSEGALKSSVSTTTAAATTAQAAQGQQQKQVRQATARKKKGGGKNIVGGKKKAPAKQESRDASDDDEDDEKKMPPVKYEAQCRGTVDDNSESN